MANIKLTPAQQTIVDKMAEGADIVMPRYSTPHIRSHHRRVAGIRVTGNTVNSLAKLNIIYALPYVMASFETVYELTDAGRALARKDDGDDK